MTEDEYLDRFNGVTDTFRNARVRRFQASQLREAADVLDALAEQLECEGVEAAHDLCVADRGDFP